MSRVVAIAVIAAAVAAPSAVAAHAPGDVTAPLRNTRPASAGNEQIDARLGPKYVTVPTSLSRGSLALPAARSASAGGFPYRRVLIAIAPVLLLLAGIVARRRRLQDSRLGSLAVDE
jgi:hypothetical protein